MKPQGVFIRALYAFEELGLRLDYSRITGQYQGDAWFVKEVDGVRGPLVFADIIGAMLHSDTPIHVAHESSVKSESPKWHRLTYNAFWSRRWPAYFWTTFPVLCIYLLLFIVIKAQIQIVPPWLVVLFWTGGLAVMSRPIYPPLLKWTATLLGTIAANRLERRNKKANPLPLPLKRHSFSKGVCTNCGCNADIAKMFNDFLCDPEEIKKKPSFEITGNEVFVFLFVCVFLLAQLGGSNSNSSLDRATLKATLAKTHMGSNSNGSSDRAADDYQPAVSNWRVDSNGETWNSSSVAEKLEICERMARVSGKAKSADFYYDALSALYNTADPFILKTPLSDSVKLIDAASR